MLNTVLQNLISNALKYIHTNGSINIGSQQIKNAIEVLVTDTGVGMDTDIKNNRYKVLKTKREQVLGVLIPVLQENSHF